MFTGIIFETIQNDLLRNQFIYKFLLISFIY